MRRDREKLEDQTLPVLLGLAAKWWEAAELAEQANDSLRADQCRIQAVRIEETAWAKSPRSTPHPSPPFRFLQRRTAQESLRSLKARRSPGDAG
ncbi:MULTISPECIES: hypothetical protein [unclassified Azospirillum]|uniref:hypothetical protein n=1 Tax=unclassified Azospirillum TaxID=2630922 RepID=UPI000B6EDF55|nr:MULTISPECIES: hypothetical protein [unclassified Azospirillum]SNS83312.1 hypothetical protein SAMN05880556_1134 [Azospirillum sp. RU38E]SNT00432.1 hypothetical protein SAMN05880591_1134 [Azospirillum sp. RU37A]